MNDLTLRQPASFAGRKALVSIGILAVCLAARKIPLPTVAPSLILGQETRTYYSVMALGVYPLLTGFVLVEIIALLVPALRPSRIGAPPARAKLHRASLIVGMFIALGQAFVLTAALERAGAAERYGAGFRMITIAILLGATAALVVLAWIADRSGLGSGFSVVILAGNIAHIIWPLSNASRAGQNALMPSSPLPMALLGMAAIVAATLWLFSRYRLFGDQGSPHPALVDRPACGIVPLTFVASLLAFTGTLLARLHSQRMNPPQPFLVATILLSIFAALMFGYLFNQPDRVTKIWTALAPNQAMPPLKEVLVESALFILLAVGVQTWLIHRFGIAYVPNFVPVILATGILCDMVSEGLAYATDESLVPVWEIHQVYAVAPTLEFLKGHSFHPFAKGLRLRTLLQFFGPYVPVQILVPQGEAQAARALLEDRWPNDSLSSTATDKIPAQAAP